MKNYKKITAVILCFVMISASSAFAANATVSVYLTPDVTIMVGDQVKSFYDANGRAVFPLIYKGTAYLPVRAMAALMGENIEWNSAAKTVYIGRTLSMPGSAGVVSSGFVRNGETPAVSRPSVQVVDAYLMRDIIIMYNFEAQNFYDVNGLPVFPLNYKGSNYLPIRAMSKLIGETVEWDQALKLIRISAKSEESPARENKNVLALKEFLADAVSISDEATAKIMQIQNPLSIEESTALVLAAGTDVRRIDNLLAEIKNFKTAGFSEAEKDAYDKQLAYIEAASYYILIIENIIYMASQGQDYSIFAETFLTFALDSQAKYEAARDVLKDL